MWNLEIVSQDEVVADHKDVSLKAAMFYVDIAKESVSVPGFSVFDTQGQPIESVGGSERSLELSEEGLVCVRGLWVHFPKGQLPQYGVGNENGGFTELNALPRGFSDPRLERQWNLKFDTKGEEILPADVASAYATTS